MKQFTDYRDFEKAAKAAGYTELQADTNYPSPNDPFAPILAFDFEGGVTGWFDQHPDGGHGFLFLTSDAAFAAMHEGEEVNN